MNESRISSSISRGKTRSRLVGMTIVGWPPVPRASHARGVRVQKDSLSVDTLGGGEGSGIFRPPCRRGRSRAAATAARTGRAWDVASAASGAAARRLGAQQVRDPPAQLGRSAALAARHARQHLLERGGVAQVRVAALAQLEVGADLFRTGAGQLAVQVLVEAGQRLAAGDVTHGWRGRMYPSSIA